MFHFSDFVSGGSNYLAPDHRILDDLFVSLSAAQEIFSHPQPKDAKVSIMIQVNPTTLCGT